MSKILITGGTGFVGSHLVEQAQAAGHQVFVLVRQSSDISNLKKLGVECLFAEISDAMALGKVFQNLQQRQVQFDTVFHCAALTIAKDLNEFLQVNVAGTKLLLDMLKQYQAHVQRFIFVSSLAACGPVAFDKTITLTHAQPITNYGKSKLLAEEQVKKAGLPYIIFRPTAIYGPREKDIFTIFQLLQRGLHPLIGSHLQQLTFIYVKDFVALLLKTINKPATNQTFFATDGNVYDKTALGNFIQQHLKKQAIQFTIPLWLVKGLAFGSQTLFALQKKSSPLNLEKYRELKAESWVCNITDTFETFHFSPTYDLQRGVAETTKWYQEEKWLT